jgi:hypothetical protein
MDGVVEIADKLLQEGNLQEHVGKPQGPEKEKHGQ